MNLLCIKIFLKRIINSNDTGFHLSWNQITSIGFLLNKERKCTFPLQQVRSFATERAYGDSAKCSAAPLELKSIGHLLRFGTEK